MKKGRKILVVSLMLIAIVVSLFAFTACKDKVNPNEKTVKLIVTSLAADTTVGDQTYLEAKTVLLEKTYKTDKLYLKDLLDIAKDDKDIDFSYSANDGFVASYTVSDTIYPKGESNAYVMLYTSVTETEYVTAGFHIVVENTKYNSCGLGITEMPLIDGETYILTYQIF